MSGDSHWEDGPQARRTVGVPDDRETPLPPEAFARELEAWLAAHDEAALPAARPTHLSAAPSRRRADDGAPLARPLSEETNSGEDVGGYEQPLHDGLDPVVEPLDDLYLDEAVGAAEALRPERAFGGRLRTAVLFAGACAAVLGVTAAGLELRSAALEAETDALRAAAVDAIDGAAATPEAMWPVETATLLDTIDTGAIETGSVGAVRAATLSSADLDATLGPAPQQAPEQPRFRALTAGRGVAPYLSASDLRTLFRSRPIRCTLSTEDAARAQAIGSATTQVFGHGGGGCAATVDYRPETGLFTATNPLRDGASLEINAAFALLGDMLCHDAAGVSALVIGDGVPFEEALSLERQVKDSYAERGDRICYKIRDVSRTLGPNAYRADVMVDGVYRPELSDPRPFLMRPRY